MTRARWISLGSLAAIVGGGIAVVFTALQLLIAIAQLIDERSQVALTLFPAHLAFWGAPALWLLYVLALIGLQAHGAAPIGIFGWVSITIAVQYSQASNCVSPLDCNFYDPGGFGMMGYIVGLLGSVIFTIGMVFYGIAALRRRPLRWGNWIPLVLGLTPLLLVGASVIAAFASSGTDYAGMQKVSIVLAVAALTPAVLWVLLGLALRPDGQEQAALQETQPAPPAPPAPVEPSVS